MLYFKVKSAAEARALFDRAVPRLETEAVGLAEAVGRVAAVDCMAPADLPEFPRAVVDGFAVRAADTFGASSGQPAYLKLAGEVPMGGPASTPLDPGRTVRISTGGMLPEGADAVVMLEYTDAAGEDLVEVFRAAAPGDGMVRRGDDLRAGDLLIPEGRRLRPQDLGLLAGVGILRLEVFRRPIVAVVPTGDELVRPEDAPGAGQVRDINTAALSAALVETGAVPKAYPIVRDEPEALRAVMADALGSADLALIAGGSSVGARDCTLEVLLSFPGAELLLHGVSIRPGKPVILVALGQKLVVGLPGNPVSALIVFDRFVRAYLRRLAGETRILPAGPRLTARMGRSCASDAGKEDYVRVRVRPEGGGYRAEPLLGKSTLMTTLVEADGLIVVPENVEGVEAGETVEVILYE
jgi:molybdopterin molybdotransferase